MSIPSDLATVTLCVVILLDMSLRRSSVLAVTRHRKSLVAHMFILCGEISVVWFFFDQLCRRGFSLVCIDQPCGFLL